MARSFPLEILTPETCFFSGEVESVVVRTLSGEEGFMANHSRACKLLDTGELRFREPGAQEYRRAKVAGGFVDVSGDVLVYTDSAEWK